MNLHLVNIVARFLLRARWNDSSNDKLDDLNFLYPWIGMLSNSATICSRMYACSFHKNREKLASVWAQCLIHATVLHRHSRDSFHRNHNYEFQMSNQSECIIGTQHLCVCDRACGKPVSRKSLVTFGIWSNCHLIACLFSFSFFFFLLFHEWIPNMGNRSMCAHTRTIKGLLNCKTMGEKNKEPHIALNVCEGEQNQLAYFAVSAGQRCSIVCHIYRWTFSWRLPKWPSKFLRPNRRPN